MEDIKKPGPWPTGLKWGIIGGMAAVLITYLASLNVDWSSMEGVKASQNSVLQYLSYFIMVLVIIFAQIEHRKRELGGYMSYSRGVGIAVIAASAAGICMAIYLYVFFGVMHPEFQQLILEEALANMEDMDPESEEQLLTVMRLTTGPGAMAIFTFLGNSLVGLIGGLILSFFTQKVNPQV